MDEDYYWFFDNIKLIYDKLKLITSYSLNVPNTLLLKDNEVKC